MLSSESTQPRTLFLLYYGKLWRLSHIFPFASSRRRYDVRIINDRRTKLITRHPELYSLRSLCNSCRPKRRKKSGSRSIGHENFSSSSPRVNHLYSKSVNRNQGDGIVFRGFAYRKFILNPRIESNCLENRFPVYCCFEQVTRRQYRENYCQVNAPKPWY